ncbi:MAG: CHC2 zinc finger domain-containing protein, partial [candidate division Zixibacteria bacterium]|nr:CHC2 zinc finger domain-containing protein [candidate division Zixibacteria bacterium]
MKKEQIEKLKKANNIIDVARDLGMIVKNNMTNCFYPDRHNNNDIHPSMYINQNHQTFRCMACGVNGDVITLIQLKTGLSFTEALEYLAKHAGLDINDNFKNPKITKLSISNNDYEQYLDVYESFIDLCVSPSGKARQWLYGRGITEKTIRSMKIKYADSPDQILNQLRSIYSSDSLSDSGLVNKKGRLFCSNYQLIWTYLKDSKPCYFQGRTLDKNIKPKEMNISKPIPSPYNINILKQKSKTIIICEGVVDTLTLTEHNYNAVGIIGVHGFKKEWLSLFKGYNIKIAFDGDIAGQQ